MSHDIWPADDGFRLSWQPVSPDNLADFKRRLSPTACIQPDYKWEIGDSLAEVEELIDIADEYELAWHPQAIADARTITEEKREEVEQLASGDYDWSQLDVELRSYQEEAAATLLNKGRVLYADPMGLGKTYGTCGAMAVGHTFPAFVVAPANAIWMWNDVLAKFGIDDVQVLDEGGLGIEPVDVWVTTWDLLRKYEEELGREGLSTVVLDEAHHIRNGKLRHGSPAGPKMAQAAYRVTRGVPYRWLLSGTFWHNHEKDILFPLQVLDRLDDLGGFWRVAKRFCGAKKVPMGDRTVTEYEEVDDSTLNRFNNLLRRTCLIRRPKDEVEDLPPRRIEKVPIDVDVGLVPRHDNDLAQEAAVREAVGKAKIDDAVSWVEDRQDEVDGLVVFAYHRDVVSEVSERVESAEKIDGSTPKTKRRSLESQFQDGEFDVLVGQLQAMGEAMTLTRSADVLFAELWWSPAAHKQALDRVHRIGQDQAVTGTFLVARDTVDERVWDTIEAKASMAAAVTDGIDLTEQDIREAVRRGL